MIKILERLKAWLFETDRGIEDPDTEAIEDYERDYQDGESIDKIDAFVIVAKPVHFEEVEKLCKHIKSGRAVLINLEKMATEERQRTVDFLSGVVMAKDGMIARVYQSVYICAPKNIGIVEE